jgi:hypothetical protein
MSTIHNNFEWHEGIGLYPKLIVTAAVVYSIGERNGTIESDDPI